jgi:protein gp37
MAATSIEWTDHSWSPIRARNKGTGKVFHFCERISPGCAHCYAATMARRFGLPDYIKANRDKVEFFLDEHTLREPLRRRKPTKFFVEDCSDLFGAWVPDDWIDRVFAVMAMADQHTFQVLTKRADRMLGYLTREYGPNGYPGQNNWCEDAPRAMCKLLAAAQEMRQELYNDPYLPCYPWPLPNVWLGVSVENQQCADERVPLLLETPAAVRFLSVEPLLGPVDLTAIQTDSHWPGKAEPSKLDALRGFTYSRRERFVLNGVVEEKGTTNFVDVEMPGSVNWVIVGAESGPGARPCDLSWVRSLRDQCVSASVPFFFKQWVANGKKFSLPELDGKVWDQFPEVGRG